MTILSVWLPVERTDRFKAHLHEKEERIALLRYPVPTIGACHQKKLYSPAGKGSCVQNA